MSSGSVSNESRCRSFSYPIEGTACATDLGATNPAGPQRQRILQSSPNHVRQKAPSPRKSNPRPSAPSMDTLNLDDSVDKLLGYLHDLLNLSINDLLAIADARYRKSWAAVRSENRLFLWFNSWIFWPLTIVYAMYLRLPLLMAAHVGNHLILFLQVACRRSELFRKLVKQVYSLIILAMTIFHVVTTTKLSDIATSLGSTVAEVIRLWLSPPNQQQQRKPRSLTELVELLEYDEVDEIMVGQDGKNNGGRLSLRPSGSRRCSMIPKSLFRAKIRVHSNRDMLSELQTKCQPLICKSRSRTLQSNLSNASLESDWFHYDADSPLSLPCTPESRAQYVSYCNLEADRVVFLARDRLRLEAQVESNDFHSREAACELLHKGKTVAFDDSMPVPGVWFACGQHVALKVDGSGCSSCRASVPVWEDIHVYIEFAITNQSVDGEFRDPLELCVGLMPADQRAVTMVGHGSRSIGLRSDGHALINGCLYGTSLTGFQTPIGRSKRSIPVVMDAASTVGMLINLPSSRVSDTSRSTPIRGVRRSEALERASVDTDGMNSDASVSGITDCERDCPDHDFIVAFNVNGTAVHLSPAGVSALRSWFDGLGGTEMFPAVSLLTKNTGAWCRFCESDVRFRLRSLIGAPEGVPVYCLDGSVLISTQQ
jgi:hypothetical protein